MSLMVQVLKVRQGCASFRVCFRNTEPSGGHSGAGVSQQGWVPHRQQGTMAGDNRVEVSPEILGTQQSPCGSTGLFGDTVESTRGQGVAWGCGGVHMGTRGWI